jgi:hypothetical protein
MPGAPVPRFFGCRMPALAVHKVPNHRAAPVTGVVDTMSSRASTTYCCVGLIPFTIRN